MVETVVSEASLHVKQPQTRLTYRRWELAKVYVSSTVADLTEERRAVLDWLRLARHQAVDSYLPDSDAVRDSCLDDVAGCDLYVLIAGHRYGYQPEDFPVAHEQFLRLVTLPLNLRLSDQDVDDVIEAVVDAVKQHARVRGG